MAQVTDASVPSSARSGPMTRSGGMSDRAIAWLFISPTILLLLAINIFPLIWTVHMSLTNYKANMGWMKYKSVGIGNYRDILTDSDLWEAMQTTAHFVFWSIVFEVVLGFGLALLINRKFRGHSFWTTIILLPMMLSPAVVGRARRRVDVDPVRDADLPGGPALDSGLHLRSCGGRPRLGLAAIPLRDTADGDAVPDACGALPRHREFQDV